MLMSKIRRRCRMGKSGKRVWFFWLVAAATSSLLLGTMRKLELKDLTAQATHVVTGTVLSVQAGWTPEGSIETKVRVVVDGYLMGVPGSGAVDLAVPGGEVGGLGLAVSDMPKFVEGTRVLLFLGLADPLKPRIVGLHQGKFTFKQGRVVENGQAENEFLGIVRAEIRKKQEAR
jgi:hypothetical protein